MLNANLVLREVETLLDGHYTAWQQRTPGRVRVYEKPVQQQIARQDSPALTEMNGTGQQTPGHETHRVAPNSSTPAKSIDVSEAVANVFLFLLLTVLCEKLTRGRSR